MIAYFNRAKIPDSYIKKSKCPLFCKKGKHTQILVILNVVPLLIIVSQNCIWLLITLKISQYVGVSNVIQVTH
jgi:hypothetical protein